MMKTVPLVSAIIPTYNRAHIICEAVDSILGQSYTNLEIIVVDDGSKDDTLERLQHYGDRVRIVTQQNAGPSIARNRGIAIARGDLIAFLDSDDLWLPTKIERQVNLLQKTGPSTPCCLCNITMRWSDREFSSFDIAWLNPGVEEGVWLNVDEVLATRFVLFNQGIIIRREVLEKTGGFDENLRFMEDYDLPLRLSREGPWAFIREPLVLWRESKESWFRQSQAEEIRQQVCTIQMFENQLKTIKGARQYELLKKRYTAELNRARRQLRAANMRQMNFIGASFVADSLTPY